MFRGMASRTQHQGLWPLVLPFGQQMLGYFFWGRSILWLLLWM
jgi:hypothetical protein